MKKSRPQAALLVCFHLRGSFPADLFTGGSNFLFLFSSDNRRQRSYPCRTAWFRCFPTYNATTAFSLPRSQLRQDRVLRLQQSPVRRVLAGCFALRLPFDYQSARHCSKLLCGCRFKPRKVAQNTRNTLAGHKNAASTTARTRVSPHPLPSSARRRRSFLPSKL